MDKFSYRAWCGDGYWKVDGRTFSWTTRILRWRSRWRCPWAHELQDHAGAYQARLTDHEIIAALRALRFHSPLLKKDQILEVLAAIVQKVAASPTKYSRSA